MDRPEGDRQRAEDLSGRRPERDDGDTPDTEPRCDVVILGLVRDARIHEVVVGPDRAPEPSCQPVHAALERKAKTEHPVARRVVHAGRDDRPEEGPVFAHEGEMRAVGTEQALRLICEPLEDRVRVPQSRDAGDDLAERLLRLGPPCDLGP